MVTVFSFLFPTNWYLAITFSGFALLILFLTYSYQSRIYNNTGKIFNSYPYSKLIFFAPIYEEVLFRAIILAFLLNFLTVFQAAAVSSIFFGLWHIKNITYQTKTQTVGQILYTGVVIGPVLAFVTIVTGDIYLAILIHSLNNYLSPFSQKICFKIRGK